MIKAVFFDVDGTLVSHTRKEVSASARAALRKLQERHIQCVVATGREIQALDTLPVKDIPFDGYVTLNGQLCLDADRNLIYGDPFAEDARALLAELFHAKELPLMLIDEAGAYLNYVDPCVVQARNAVSTAVPEPRTYTGGPIYQAIAYIDQSQEETYRNLLPGCTITRWNPYAVDVMPCGGGKVNGIRQYLKRHGIDRQEIMAFGDGENDMEMLQFADVGIAMGNAEPCVKACADHVTSSVDECGIENALKKFQLIREE
jgi:hypothetical protein